GTLLSVLRLVLANCRKLYHMERERAIPFPYILPVLFPFSPSPRAASQGVRYHRTREAASNSRHPAAKRPLTWMTNRESKVLVRPWARLQPKTQRVLRKSAPYQKLWSTASTANHPKGIVCWEAPSTNHRGRCHTAQTKPVTTAAPGKGTAR